MSSISVIVVARNAGKLLFATIESVLQQKKLSELIIVDNGNSPDVISRLQQRALSEARLRILSSNGEMNYAEACNMASRDTGADYIIFLKAGYLMPPEALVDMVSVLETEKNAMLTTGLVQDYDGEPANLFRNHIVTPKSTLLEIITFGTSKKNNVITGAEFATKPFEVATVNSACMCVRLGDYKKLGGLDADFFAQDEEFDFTLRVQQVGGRVLCVPSVKITRMPFLMVSDVAVYLSEAKNLVRYLNKFFASRMVFGALFLLNILIMLQLASRVIASKFRWGGGAKSVLRSNAAKKLMTLALGTVDIQKNDKFSGQIILVTGATSQIGLCVMRRFIASGAGVLALTRYNEVPYYHPNLRWIHGDLGDPNFNLQGYCVDVVVHCAPLWYLPPVLETLKKLEARRIIAFSDTMVFANLLTAQSFEKDVVLKLQNGEAQLAEKCSALSLPYTLFRPTSAYGVGLDKTIPALSRIIDKLGMMLVYPPAIGRRQPVHVDDLSIAVVLALTNEGTYNKSYNLSGGESFTFREMVERIFELSGKNIKIINSTALPFILDIIGKITRNRDVYGELARRMNDDMVFFHDDAKQDFAYSPRKFLSGGRKDVDGF